MAGVRIAARHGASLALAVAAAAIALAAPRPAEAQLTRGAVGGGVTDETEAVIPGVTVTATSQATGAERVDVTNQAGFYRLGALEPGRYTVRVELQGFKPNDGSALNARDNLQKDAGFDRPPRENRNQFGAALGGPIAENRTFFFGLYDGTRLRRSAELGDVTRVPTPQGVATLHEVPLRPGQPAESRQAVLDALDFLSDVHAEGPALRDIHEDTTVNGVPIETANVAVGRRAPQDTDQGLVRIDVLAKGFCRAEAPCCAAAPVVRSAGL